MVPPIETGNLAEQHPAPLKDCLGFEFGDGLAYQCRTCRAVYSTEGMQWLSDNKLGWCKSCAGLRFDVCTPR